MMKMLDVCVVVVTYNRLEKLKKALNAYENLTAKPSYFIIVNNGSMDGTDAYLRQWQETEGPYKKLVVSLEKNTGGSGGFYEGIKKGCSLGCSWIWVADDDAYPEENSFEILSDYMQEDCAAVCTRIESVDGTDTWHRRRLKKGLFLMKEEKVETNQYASVFEIDLFSYVGTLLSVKAVEKAGLPEKEFFINYDDTEHSIRMAQEGKIICVPAAVVYHDSPGVTSDVLSWKKYYAVRNKLYSYKKHFGWRYECPLRCYYSVKAIIKSVKNHNADEYRIVRKAIKDGEKGRLGVDEIYCPGWKSVL